MGTMASRESTSDSEQHETIRAPEHIQLFPISARVTVGMLREQVPTGPIWALDFKIFGDSNSPSVESWKEVRSHGGILIGFQRDNITNLDHHAEHVEMQRPFSTANAAIIYVREHGPVLQEPILIHHTDCDSTLSSLILSGAIPPDDRFGEAVIAADHTGATNKIADLLQALEKERDLAYSAAQLDRLLRGLPLDVKAQALLDKRVEERELAKEIVFHDVGDGVYLGQSDKQVEGAFFPALVPEARIIVYAAPHENQDRWHIRVRVGQRWPAGASLNRLNLPNFGGRWNAGSTGRSGGTPLSPEDYATLIRERLRSVYGHLL